jgi:hypothetical protein
MDAETWILPKDAVAYGFATDIDEPDEDDDGPQQSAFGAICRKLMAVQPEAVLEETEAIDLDALADDIADRVSAKLAAREETDNTPANGWDTFFKGE